MINIKPEVLQALENNSALVSLLGGKRIYLLRTLKSEEFPRITFFETSNYDSDFADDEPIGSEILIQIDIWSKPDTNPPPPSTSAIAQEVDETMKSLGFRRTSSTDLYEEDTKIIHKVMRYLIKREE